MIKMPREENDDAGNTRRQAVVYPCTAPVPNFHLVKSNDDDNGDGNY